MTNDMELTKNERDIIEALRAAEPHTVLTITKNAPNDKREFRVQALTSVFLPRDEEV